MHGRGRNRESRAGRGGETGVQIGQRNLAFKSEVNKSVGTELWQMGWTVIALWARNHRVIIAVGCEEARREAVRCRRR